MATVWSLATISCMFTRSYGQLLAARAVVGLGEAGYGSVGAALIVSLFPARMRGALLARFFAAASVGSVLGVLLGGLIAARWGWQAAFGVVGVPGLVLALLYLQGARLPHRRADAAAGRGHALDRPALSSYIVRRSPVRARMLWVCLGGAAQLIVVSAVWSWLPSFLNRVHGIAPDQAADQSRRWWCCAALSAAWSGARRRPRRRTRPRDKLLTHGAAVHLPMLVLAPTFWARRRLGRPDGASAVRADRCSAAS